MSLPTAPDQIAVLLGASNLTLAWPRLMPVLLSGFPGHSHIYTAQGMGRSYIFPESGFAARKLPGIFASGIWNALAEISTSQGAEKYALITDLGNDLLYGGSALEVVDSAREAITRLRQWSHDCKIIVTGPPVASVNQLGWFRFLLARTVLFPKTQLTLANAKQQTTELDQRLEELATQHSVELVRPLADWYGFDPIHILRQKQQAAFQEILSTWQLREISECHGRTVRWRPTAQVRRVFGREKFTPQPVVTSERCHVYAY